MTNEILSRIGPKAVKQKAGHQQNKQITNRIYPIAVSIGMVMGGSQLSCGGNDESLFDSKNIDGGADSDANGQDATSETSIDSSNDATTDITADTNTPDIISPDNNNEVLITKGEIALALTENIMGYTQNAPCIPVYPDINNDRLCNSTNLISTRTGVSGGNFNPSDHLTRKQMVDLVSTTVGFLNDLKSCQNIPVNQIQGTQFGAFCRHNIPITSPGQDFNPDDLVGMEEWYTEFEPALTSYFSDPSTRLSVSENAYKIILDKDWNPNATCVSQYSDITPNSPECAITNDLIAVGALDASDPTFNGQNPSDWATTMKIYVESAKPFLNPNLYQSICTLTSTELSCSGAYKDSFACPHAEALCANNLIDPTSMTGTNITAIPTKLKSSRLAWNIQLERDK